MIYAMSDVHGSLDAFEKSLSAVDLSDGTSKLVLCGDYCDRGPASLQVFQRIIRLQHDHPNQVIALRGNHEEMLLEYVDMVDDPDFTRAWMMADSNLATAKSFLGHDSFVLVKHLLEHRQFTKAYQFVVTRMKEKHADVIAWIRKLPYFYETPRQVFVHAGVDEEAGDLWRIGTPAVSFTAMEPEYVGQHWTLDVIAGHIDTETISGIPGYEGIWHDGASHYYIDGGVMRTGHIPVLAYDECEQKYQEANRKYR